MYNTSVDPDSKYIYLPVKTLKVSDNSIKWCTHMQNQKLLLAQSFGLMKGTEGRTVRLQTIDLLVCFSADSRKMDATKIKKKLHRFIFFIAPDSPPISRTIGPTGMVYLSIFAELNNEYHYSVLEMTVKTSIV